MKTNPFFPEIHGVFGFGCMRLPMIGDEVDEKQFSLMIDRFLEAGFNYFDTAHGYIDGKSEKAIARCLSARYDRSKFLLTNKLTAPYFNCEADIRPFFESQLAACGVDYFDFYLMHAQSRENFPKFKACRAYETAFELKKEGKVRFVGLSFHDNAETLEEILDAYPEVDAVQIQFNYADYNDPAVDSKRIYEVCVNRNKPVIVMEPVKGGTLVRLPEEGKKILDDLHGGSAASYALRFVAGFPQMFMILSGMSSIEQMEDNLSFMTDPAPLDDREKEAVEKVRRIVLETGGIPCTGCRYCVTDNHCPKNILIPDVFSAYNSKVAFHTWSAGAYYHRVLIKDHGKASDCISCGLCEKVCPAHLPIREYLKKAAETFEKR